MNKEEKITTGIKVPNKDLEVLKKHFPHYFDKNGNFDFEKFKNYLTEKEINFSTESYGLEWLGKSYARLLASDPATTLLKADETHNNKPENAHAENLLIKGDNLEVLKHLANAYYEKIKMIYIDPPYNTGNDGFVYNDDRKYTVKELQNLIGIDEEKAKRILEFTQSKSNSHSAWLTFMYPRLYIARQLLRDDGVIFVSIDDNEVAQLRLLMDEVFGEENFVRNVIWEKKYSPANDSTVISDNHDHILVFCKNINNWEMGLLERTKEMNERYVNLDDDPRGPWKPGGLSAKTYSKNYDYPIKTPSGKIVNPPSGSSWQISKERFEELLKDNRIYFGKNGDSKPQIKQFLFEVKQGLVPKSIWKFDEVGHNQISRKEVTDLFGSFVFDNPKPINLLKRILLVANCKNSDIILDFFAGSGTTGDAVMQLNAEDGGNRKFILVQLPEPIDPKKNKTAYDFVKNELGVENPTIFEITKERLLRAAKKINAGLDEKINSLQQQIKKLESEIPTEENQQEIEKLKAEITQHLTLKTQNSFKIFETMPIWEDYHFEAEEFDNSLNLFDESKLTEEDIKALLTTWKTYDGIALTQELESVVLSADSLDENKTQNSTLNTKNYTAYYGNGKLYLMHKGFTTDHL